MSYSKRKVRTNYIHRGTIAKTDDPPRERTCKYCGKPFVSYDFSEYFDTGTCRSQFNRIRDADDDNDLFSIGKF